MSDTSKPVYRFAVIGGDGRMTHLGERLAEEGHAVCFLGCGETCLSSDARGHLRVCATLSKAVEEATAVILPLPATRDGITVHCPRDPACRVCFSELAALMKQAPDLRLFGGKLPADLVREEPRVTDYYESEVLQLRNAYLTAEAALMTAMELTDRAMRGMRVAVVGYGRIGRYLSRLLLSLGAEVTVCARRAESLFEAAAEGCHPRLLSDGGAMEEMVTPSAAPSVIFNTVPAHVLSRGLLLGLPRDALLIDLASSPFGVVDEDVRVATAERGLRYLRAPSLPGAYAPRDAGRIIAECVLGMLAEEPRTPLAQEKGGEGV